MGGDDLDDGLLLEAVVSEDEQEELMKVHPSRMKRKSPDADAEGKKKKKKSKGKGGEGEEGDSGAEGADGYEQMKKPKKKAKQDKMLTRIMAEDAKITGDQAAQAGFFWDEFLADHGEKLSELELDEFRVETEHFVETPSKHVGSTRTLADIKNYIKAIEPQWQQQLSTNPPGKALRKPGHPTIVIITLGGQRAADIFKEMREFHSMARMGKLFAKHISVEEQKKFLETTKTRVVVGTPNRIDKLVEIGALGLSNVKYIILDCNRDVKGMNLFRIKAVRDDFFKLFRSHLAKVVKEGKAKLTLF
eukprot:comp23339_c3_seq1/m.38487 comp23339_c3_seq1/g.38487  ORF comp23339_c3_seq1/g.38487 comp23339_c3_seq1/m.38487 type:complete len:304 (-) comp23339_c3_seq1:383-1294(-)